MKWTYFSLLLMVMMLMQGCKKGDQPEQPFLNLEKSELVLGAEASKTTIKVESNIGKLAVHLSERADWLIYRLYKDHLELIVKEHTGREPRSVEVSIKGGDLAKKIVVTQGIYPASLEVEPLEVSFPAKGGDQAIAVTSNVSWEYKVQEGADWLTGKQEGQKLVLTAESYGVDGTRTATVVISAESVQKEVKVTQEGKALWYSISVPAVADFKESRVYHIAGTGGQIAEFCYEYINVLGDNARNEAEIVVYPVIDGKADLTKGIITSDGASISWNSESNTATITPLPTPRAVTEVYYDGSNILREVEAGRELLPAPTPKPTLLRDVRIGANTVLYPITKVGTQYWMAAPLRATHYQDGTPIVFKALADTWSTTEGAYTYPEGQKDNVELLGHHYNGYAVQNDKGLAPKGWKIPHNDDFLRLKTYLSKSTGTKVKGGKLWNGETPGTLTNITGLNIMPAGHRAEGSNEYMIGVRAFIWTSVKSYDPLFRTEAMNYVMLNAGKNALYTNFTSQLHNLEAGHTVICIRE